jgi:hypothetical protein
MSSIETIADAKIQSALDRRLLALTSTISSLKQEMNNRGLLVSSVTVQRIHDECIALLDQVRDDMKIEFTIVLDERLWVTDKLSAGLILSARRHLEKVKDRAHREMTDAAQSLLNRGTHCSLNEDISLACDRVLTDLSLLIDSHKKVKCNRAIKSGLWFVPKLVIGLFKMEARQNTR